MKKEEKKIEEKKETTKDYSIEKQDQKRLKGISKFFYIIAKILKVLGIIGIVGVGIAMIAIPIITSNIKTEKVEGTSILKIFDTDFVYERTDKSFIFYEKDKINDKKEITSQKDIDALNKAFDYLEENDLSKLTIFAEIELVLVVVALVIEIKILKNVYKFFKNIHDESTPFIKDNIELLKGIGKLSIIELVVALLISVVSNIMIGTTVSVNIVTISEVLGVFAFMYIFEYGYKLQNDTKGKIYSKD